MYDIVIPYHPKDEATLELCLRQIHRHLTGWSQIYVLAEPPAFESGKLPIRYRLPSEFVVNWVDEGGPQSVENYYKQRNPAMCPRAGWVHQCLLKLCASKWIEGLSEKYICVDADVLFMRHVPFFSKDIWFQYHRCPHHGPYVDMFERLTGIPYPRPLFSYVMHHMMYRQSRLDDMITHVRRYTRARCFQWAVLKNLNVIEASPFAECDTFAAWMISTCREETEPRQLQTRDVPFVPSEDWIRTFENTDIDLVACHAYMREQ